ncbi:hypothetical protein ACP70R_028692 [Stipagrostis hirtigluma subsp. patula]
MGVHQGLKRFAFVFMGRPISGPPSHRSLPPTAPPRSPEPDCRRRLLLRPLVRRHGCYCVVSQDGVHVVRLAPASAGLLLPPIDVQGAI